MTKGICKISKGVEKIQQNQSGSGCPPHWKPHKNSCFKLTNFRYDHKEAIEACHEQGAELATILDEEVNEVLANELVWGKPAWIGLIRKSITSDDWIWMNKTAPRFVKWGDNGKLEPLLVADKPKIKVCYYGHRYTILYAGWRLLISGVRNSLERCNAQHFSEGANHPTYVKEWRLH